jgi:hypothetical protein
MLVSIPAAGEAGPLLALEAIRGMGCEARGQKRLGRGRHDLPQIDEGKAIIEAVIIVGRCSA